MHGLNLILAGNMIQPVAVKTAFELMPADSLIVKALLRDLAYSWSSREVFLGLGGLEELGQMPGFFIAFTREICSRDVGNIGPRLALYKSDINNFLVRES